MAVVEVVTCELVAPSEPTPRHAVWLSNLDLGARNGYSPTVYFFRRAPGDDGRDRPEPFFSAGVLRAALAKTLVPFHPFAGRLRAGRDGRAEIDCSAEGALFVVARSDAQLDDFDGFAPSRAMRDMFVPPYDHAGADAPLLMLQVTFFRCGGVALGTAMHHFVIDGRSAFHFIQTWASIARGGLPRLALRVLGARPAPRRRVPALHHGRHARPPHPAAPGRLLRQRGGAHVGVLLSAADGLGFGARRLRAATAHGDGFARSVVDHLESADLAARGGGLPRTDLRVISWMGMPSHDADFGWGEPVVLAPALMYYAGFVYLLSCPGKAGDVAVAVALEPECMARFKQLFFEEMAAAME